MVLRQFGSFFAFCILVPTVEAFLPPGALTPPTTPTTCYQQNNNYEDVRHRRLHSRPPMAFISPYSGGRSNRGTILLSAKTTPHASRMNWKQNVRPLSATDDNNSSGDMDQKDDEASDKMMAKVQGRKKRVMIGYRLSAVIYAMLGLSTLIPIFLRPAMAPIALNYAGGPTLAAGVAYILAGAAENDRLGSDTYKRLNFFLSKFGFLWLAAAVLVRQVTPLSRGAKILSNPLVVLASLSALVNGIKGRGYGVKGFDKANKKSYLGDLLDLAKNSIQIIVSPNIPNVKAGFYMAGTAFIGGLTVSKLVDLTKMLMGVGGQTLDLAKVGSWAMAFAKINLLTAAMCCLADAAKRDRLEGTTFIELNALSSFTWFGIGGEFEMHWSSC